MILRRFFVGRAIGLLVVLIVGGGIYFFLYQPSSTPTEVLTFEDCVAAGNPVMESYPRQCATKDGKHFTEHIGNELEKADLIRLDSPRPNESIKSPLTITGEARGNWYFEASFPIYVTDWDGKIIGEGYATAQEDWMTTEFVPFTAVLTFNTAEISGQYSSRGTLILKKDNASGLPEHDDALEIPIVFGGFAE